MEDLIRYHDKVKLYLSSYRIPAPDDLVLRLGKPLEEVSVALVPNAIVEGKGI